MRAGAFLPACLCLLASAIGCGASDEPASQPTEAAPRIDGTPAEGVPIDGAPVVVDGAAIAASTLAGSAAIATDRGLFRARTDGTFERVAFHDGSAGGDPRIVSLTRRGAGLLVLTDRGLFHDAQGLLARSPLSDAIAPLGVKRVDVLGDVVWLTAERGAYRVKNGALERASIPGLDGAPDAVVGVRDDVVLVAVPGSIRLVDLAASSMRDLGSLGSVAAFDRGDDGAVHLATERGLLSCTTELVCTVRTFADAGEPARAVTGVSAAYGRLSAIVGDALVAIEASAARIVARAPTGASAVSVDAAGDAWFVAKGAAARAPLGSPPSFARDVVPFLDAHCLGCHAAGTNGAPKLPLRDYDKAVLLAPLMVKRIRAEGAPPMPPSSVERLAPNDYAAVVRWAATGTKP